MQLHLAKDRAKFIAINSSWQLAPWADVLYGCDWMWWHAHKGVPQFTGLKITQDGPRCAALYPAIKPVFCDRKTDNLLMQKFGVIGWGGNSGFHTVNLAAQFGVSKIILVGYDMRMDKGLHWHGKHGHNLNNPTANNILRWCRAIDDAAKPLAALGIQVFNVSPISMLKNYPKVSFEEALAWIP